MNQPNGFLVFTLGCVGALAPEIVRLYRLRAHPPERGFSSFYYLISVIYALLGGVVAIVLPAVTMRAALFAGVTTSIAISAAARNIQALGSTAKSADETAPARERRPFSELLRTHANGIFTQTD